MSTIFGITEDKMKETSSTFDINGDLSAAGDMGEDMPSDRGEQRRTSEIYRSGYQMWMISM